MIGVIAIHDSHDIVLLQETLFLYQHFRSSHSIHTFCYGDGIYSAKREDRMMVGKSDGGLAVLWIYNS